MNTPIIDPSTLTEEQRKEIKAQSVCLWRELFAAIDSDDRVMFEKSSMAITTLEWLFGSNFFEEGE